MDVEWDKTQLYKSTRISDAIVMNYAPYHCWQEPRGMGKDFQLHARIYEQSQLSKENIFRLGASWKPVEKAFDIVSINIVGD